MKITTKIIFIVLLSIFISTITSIIIVTLLIIFFDKSYTRYDIERISENIIEITKNFNELNETNFKNYFSNWHNKDINFTVIEEKTKRIIFSTIQKDKIPSFDFIKRRIDEEEEKRKKNIFKEVKFLEMYKRKDFEIGRPIFINGEPKAMLFLSVNKNLLPPFNIRINNQRLLFIYGMLFILLATIVLISFLCSFIFTLPIIRRLSMIYNKIENFSLDNPTNLINDNKDDEIGTIARVFDKMAKRIKQDHNEKIRFYKERQELIKNISHDFRTPLTSILGYSISLEEGFYKKDEEKKFYSIIRKKAEYMSKLFDELMELYRLDSNEIILNKQKFDISELLREIIIEYLPQLEENGFTIETEILDNFIFYGDRERLGRAIRNLIDNVVKHCKEGKYIGIFLEKNGVNGISIKIKDKGIGISEEEKNMVFNKFYRSTKSRGMGLGLSIAKEIIEKHDGKIYIIDNTPCGTIFVIEI